MSVPAPTTLDAIRDDELLCYCTHLTFGELRAACARGAWPPAGKERTGRLCTGCEGDVLHCLRVLGMRPSP